MTTAALNYLILKVLDYNKSKDIINPDVRELSAVMDTLIIVSGTSNRHVKVMVDNVEGEAKTAGIRPLSIEEKDGSEWVLVDFGDTVVQAMLPATRELHDLERLWQLEPTGHNAD